MPMLRSLEMSTRESERQRATPAQGTTRDAYSGVGRAAGEGAARLAAAAAATT
jgi:hypothetical protein